VTSLTISFSEYLRKIFNNFTKNVGKLYSYLLNYLHETDTTTQNITLPQQTNMRQTSDHTKQSRPTYIQTRTHTHTYTQPTRTKRQNPRLDLRLGLGLGSGVAAAAVQGHVTAVDQSGIK